MERGVKVFFAHFGIVGISSHLFAISALLFLQDSSSVYAPHDTCFECQICDRTSELLDFPWEGRIWDICPLLDQNTLLLQEDCRTSQLDTMWVFL